jgi:hypothetical protein
MCVIQCVPQKYLLPMNTNSKRLSPHLPEVESETDSGTIFAGPGVALVRHDDDFYYIELGGYSYKEVVHKLTPDELGHIHMHNLHLNKSTKLTTGEIGAPPFAALVERLKYSHRLSGCITAIDIFLDPMEQMSAKIRYSAAALIEQFLREVPGSTDAIFQELKCFVPPEGYKIETETLMTGSGSPAREQRAVTFAERFPAFSGILMRTQPEWEENTKLPGIQRLTRAHIQKNTDDTTDLSSRNLLRRAKETFETLNSCVEEIGTGQADKWKTYWGTRRLANAKGQILVLTKDDRLSKDKERYAEAEARQPGLLARFEEAEGLLTRSKVLLIEVEKNLGEIKAAKFLC